MVVTLEEASRLALDLVGSKGASLARMMAQGLPIPRGFVLTADEFDAFHSSPSNFALSLQRLAHMVKGVRTSLWACRSSATVEDGHQASYAGRFRTYLNIRSAELSRYVTLCWKSALSDEVEIYRNRVRDQRRIRMAVVVQEMVPAIVSGVAFASDSELILEASWGLGEAIVGGLAEPDRWVFREGALSLQGSHIGRKQVRLFSPPRSIGRSLFGDPVRHPSFGQDHSIVVQATDQMIACIPADLDLAARTSCLSAERVTEIAELCRLVVSAQGGPQDIEWAWDGRQFSILQCRPITQSILGRSDVALKPTPVGGLGVSTGTAVGSPKAVWNEEDLAQVQEGDILVAFQTQPSYIEALTRCRGVVTETGGLLSHAAIVCRELGKPCVVGVPDARARLSKVPVVEIDGLAGTVRIAKDGDQPVPAPATPLPLPRSEATPVIGDRLPWRV